MHGRQSPQQSSSYSSRLQSRHFRLACARWGCCLPALRSAFCRATLAFFFSACLRWRSFLASASLTAAALCSRSLALSSSSDGGSALHSHHTLLLASGASCGYQSPPWWQKHCGPSTTAMPHQQTQHAAATKDWTTTRLDTKPVVCLNKGSFVSRPAVHPLTCD